MPTWETVVNTAKTLATAAGRKATDMADIVALKMELNEKEHALRQVMEALGHLLYDSKKSGCDADVALVTELVEQADGYYQQLARLQTAVDELCARKTCSCGTVNPKHASYCNECGEKL